MPLPPRSPADDLEPSPGLAEAPGLAEERLRREQADEGLRLSEQRLRTALAAVPVTLAQQDLDLVFTWVHNPPFGFRSEQVVGGRSENFIDGEVALRINEARREVLRTGKGSRLQTSLTHDGQERYFDMVFEPLRDGSGEIAGLTTAVIDVSAAKQTEMALRESEARLDRYRLLSQHARDIVLFIHSDGRILEANDAAVAAYGYDRETLLTLTIFDLRDGAAAPDLSSQMTEADSVGFTFETLHRRRDGTPFPVEVSSRGAEIAGERLLLGIIRDITERLQAERSLRDADRRKDEFLATLAHELRNPLAPIRNALEILRRTSPPEPGLQWARDIIDRQVQQLTRLVDDLLDVSPITRGKIELHRERLELAAIVERALETSRPVLEAAHHRLTVDYPEGSPSVMADPTRMAQVLSNLLNNAAKYTQTGGHIRLSVSREGSDGVVRIQDDGVGIPPGMLTSIFDMFAQVDSSLERAQGGLGIGLTIARSLVEMHGGTLEAASGGLGQGSELTVRLPLAPEAGLAAEAEREPAARAAHASLRILVVDDNEDSAESLAMWLGLMGSDVRTAHGGPEALEAAQEYHPEVIFLDIGMPGMNGYDVARRLRARPETRNAVLIATTGGGQEEDRRQSKEAGFDEHLVKPLDPKSLDELIARLAERKGTSL